MLRGKLQRVNDAKNFVKVATRGHGIAQLQLDLLIWPDDKYSSHSGVVGSSTPLSCIPALGRQHAIQFCEFELRIADHRVVDLCYLGFLNILAQLIVVPD